MAAKPAFIYIRIYPAKHVITRKCVYKTLCPKHMPDPKGKWSLKENNSELHYGIRSKVNQFIYTFIYYMPNIRILAKALLQKKGNNSTENLRNRFKSC